MKIINRYQPLALLLIMATTSQAVTFFDGRSFFMPRPQGINSARDLTGWHRFINRSDTESVYGAFAATPAYNQSFRPDYISHALIGTPAVCISGSQVSSMTGGMSRGSQDLLADYFGLSPRFESTVSFNPTIKNLSCDMAFYVGFHHCYLRVHAPLVWTHWNLGLSEVITATGLSTDYPPLYMATPATAPGATSFIQALQGNTRFGDMQTPLKYGKVHCGQHKGGVADIEAALGWNFIDYQRGFLGFNVRTIIPTGTRPRGEYFFEPVVGNGHHWGAGVGFDGRVLLWEADGEQEFNLFGQLNCTHLFNARQIRSFDYNKNGFFSRYMLLKSFDANGNYDGTLVPAINQTTFACNVSTGIQVDFSAMFGYTFKRFVLDVGYNAWSRTHEKVDIMCCQNPTHFALKGIQDAIGNNTESNATIFGGLYSDRAHYADPNPPVYTGLVSERSAESTSMLSQKIFIYVGYNAELTDARLMPFIGLGSEIEFEGYNLDNTEQFVNTTMSQWGVWVKGGFGF
jgi:hypothetical protein